MNARLVLACALSGVALVVGGAGTASAADPSGTLSLGSDGVLAGARIGVEALCIDDGGVPPPLESAVLEAEGADDWLRDTAGWRLSSSVVVRADALPGTWPVTLTCADERISTDLRIVAPPEHGYAAIWLEADRPDGQIEREVFKPGEELLVAAICVREEFVRSPVTSPVLLADDLVRIEPNPISQPMQASGVIPVEVRPGVYEVSFTCVDRKVSSTFTVRAEQSAGEEPVVVKAAADAQVPVKPRGAPDTGSLAADTSANSPVGVAVGIGAVLLGAGGLGAAAVARRRRA
jgi:hypothetical protein